MAALGVEDIKNEILKELDKTKKYLDWTPILESLEYFRGKQKAFENVLSWIK